MTGSSTTITMHDMGLCTIIGKADRGASGKPLSTPMEGTIKRLRAWDDRNQTTKYRSVALRRAPIEMNGLKDKLSVPDAVFERAAYLFRKAYEMGMAWTELPQAGRHLRKWATPPPTLYFKTNTFHTIVCGL